MHSASDDHAHDRARLPARRHECDQDGAKERRRRQEREVAEARALLTVSPLRLARTTLWTAGSALVAIAGGWAAARALLGPSWAFVVDVAAAAIAVGVQAGAVVACGRIRSRRERARALLRAREAPTLA